MAVRSFDKILSVDNIIGAMTFYYVFEGQIRPAFYQGC